jgi:hypothetical protein
MDNVQPTSDAVKIALMAGMTETFRRNYPAHFERLKNTFFLCDRYPQNRDRFGLTFEDRLIENPLTETK